jgi:hypothetical protein
VELIRGSLGPKKPGTISTGFFRLGYKAYSYGSTASGMDTEDGIPTPLQLLHASLRQWNEGISLVSKPKRIRSLPPAHAAILSVASLAFTPGDIPKYGSQGILPLWGMDDQICAMFSTECMWVTSDKTLCQHTHVGVKLDDLLGWLIRSPRMHMDGSSGAAIPTHPFELVVCLGFLQITRATDRTVTHNQFFVLLYPSMGGPLSGGSFSLLPNSHASDERTERLRKKLHQGYVSLEIPDVGRLLFYCHSKVELPTLDNHISLFGLQSF